MTLRTKVCTECLGHSTQHSLVHRGSDLEIVVVSVAEAPSLALAVVEICLARTVRMYLRTRSQGQLKTALYARKNPMCGPASDPSIM